MRIFSVNYYRVLLALCALALAGNVSTSAKTITDIPTHLLGDWDIVAVNQWGKEERGLMTLRKVPVHAWVQVTRKKILLLGREPNSEIDSIEGEFLVTFFWKRDASQNRSSTGKDLPRIRTEGNFSH